MTAEIALLNRSAVALAADSAVTITYWRNGQSHTRYSKSANKIFHISESRPVGMMIYQAANLQGMPWEIIAKAYRERRGATSFDKLDGYVTDVFNFIITDENLFPPDIKEKQLSKNVELAAARICVRCRIEKAEEASTDDEKKALVAKRLAKAGADVDAESFIDSIDFEEVFEELDKRRAAIIAEFTGYPSFDRISQYVDPDALFVAAARSAFKKESDALSDTGVVFAGFGDAEYFPRILQYRCYGVLLGKLIYDVLKDDHITISHDNVSAIEPIATSNMINTFIHGASMSALEQMDKLFEKHLSECLSEISKASGQVIDASKADPLKSEAKDNFSKEMMKHLWTEHSQPLRQVIGMLSVSELAELAETLISIESLKERVTRPTESVSGPIDVALISKTDGFIWIKRKHYFDKELNPRYFRTKDA